jgi:hypothetical protein
MIPILFAVILFFAVAQILWALRREGGVLEYPFLASWVYIFFILAQIFVVWQENKYDEYPIVRLLIMVFLCQTAGFIGYASSNTVPRKVDETCDVRYLKFFAIGSVIVGGFFHFRLLMLPEEMRTLTQWSGVTVAYLFLSKPLFFGGMIALSIALRNNERAMMGLAAITLLYSLSTIIIGGRRGPMVEISLAALTIVYFVKRWTVPRLLVMAVIPLGVIFVNGVAIYRTSVFHGQAYGSHLSLSEIPARVATGISAVADRANECILPAEALEIRNAISYMETISEQGQYDYGTGLWDLLVHRYVPAQIFGRDFKESLKFGFIESTVNHSVHRAVLGTTMTGFTDSFQAFGYFGAIYFFISGVILRRLWNSASAGNFTSQIAYGVLIRDGLEAITHHSCYVFAGIVVVWAFVVIPISLLRRASSKGNSQLLLNPTAPTQNVVPTQRAPLRQPGRFAFKSHL